MKKYLILLLTFVFSLSLMACGGDSKRDDDKEKETTQPHIVETEPREKFISPEDLMKCVTLVEVTPENWKEYFTVVEIEEMQKDAMGEENGYLATDWYMQVNDGWELAETVQLKFSYKQTHHYKFIDTATGEVKEEGIKFDPEEPYEDIVQLFLHELRYEPHQKWFKDVMYQNDFQCDEGEMQETRYEIIDFTCISTKGRVGRVQIPEEYWNVGSSGTRYLNVGSMEGGTIISEQEWMVEEILRVCQMFQ